MFKVFATNWQINTVRRCLHRVASVIVMMLAIWQTSDIFVVRHAPFEVDSVFPFLGIQCASFLGLLLTLVVGTISWRHQGRDATTMLLLSFTAFCLWYLWESCYSPGLQYGSPAGVFGTIFRISRVEERNLPLVFVLGAGALVAADLVQIVGRSAGNRPSTPLCEKVSFDGNPHFNWVILVLMTLAGFCFADGAECFDTRFYCFGAFGLPLFGAYYLACFGKRTAMFFSFLPLFSLWTAVACLGWSISFSVGAQLTAVIFVMLAFQVCFIFDYVMWKKLSVPATFSLAWFVLIYFADRSRYGSGILNAGLLFSEGFKLLPYLSAIGLTTLLFAIPSWGLYLVFSALVDRQILVRLKEATPSRFLGWACNVTGTLFCCILPIFGKPPHCFSTQRATERAHCRVALVQGVERDSWQDRQSSAVRITQKYCRLTYRAFSERPFDICVWPEYAVPCDPQLRPEILEAITKAVRDLKITLIFGCSTKDRQSANSYDSAVVMGPSGSVIGKYDSIRPMPLQKNLAIGKNHQLFQTPLGKFGILICFEESSSAIAADYARQGADFLIAIANDAAFENTRGFHLAFNECRARALELRLPVVRSCNTGISGIFDRDGRVLMSVPVGAEAFGSATVHY